MSGEFKRNIRRVLIKFNLAFLSGIKIWHSFAALFYPVILLLIRHDVPLGWALNEKRGDPPGNEKRD